MKGGHLWSVNWACEIPKTPLIKVLFNAPRPWLFKQPPSHLPHAALPHGMLKMAFPCILSFPQCDHNQILRVLASNDVFKSYNGHLARITNQIARYKANEATNITIHIRTRGYIFTNNTPNSEKRKGGVGLTSPT